MSVFWLSIVGYTTIFVRLHHCANDVKVFVTFLGTVEVKVKVSALYAK